MSKQGEGLPSAQGEERRVPGLFDRIEFGEPLLHEITRDHTNELTDYPVRTHVMYPAADATDSAWDAVRRQMAAQPRLLAFSR